MIVPYDHESGHGDNACDQPLVPLLRCTAYGNPARLSRLRRCRHAGFAWPAQPSRRGRPASAGLPRLNGSSSIGQRRQTARQIHKAYRRLGQIQAESRQVAADLDSINARTSSAGALISTYLIVPYTSAAGYCACYDTKRDRLAAIATQIAQQRARLTPLFLRRNTIRQEVFNSLSVLPSQTTVFRMLGSIVFIATILVFILFNVAAAVITAIVGLLLIAVVLLDTIINLMDVQDRIMAIRQNIVRLNLAYYRMQSIATCRQAPLPEEEDENSWWQQALPDYAIGPDASED